MASGWKMQSESMEMMISAFECSRALHTVRAFPQLKSLRPTRIGTRVKSRCAFSIHSKLSSTEQSSCAITSKLPMG